MYALIIMMVYRTMVVVPGFDTWDLCAAAAKEAASMDHDRMIVRCVRVKK